MSGSESTPEESKFQRDLDAAMQYVKNLGEISDELAMFMAEQLIEEFTEYALKLGSTPEQRRNILIYLYGSNVEALLSGAGGDGGIKLGIALETVQKGRER